MTADGEHLTFLSELNALGEHTAAGFLARPGADPLTRMTDALASQWSQAELCVWDGGPLYPAGRYSWYQQGSAVSFHYSSSLQVDRGRLADRASQSGWPRQGVYERLLQELGDYPQPWMAIPPAYRVGGANYTHSILNYGRVVREGLEAYAARVASYSERTRCQTRTFYQAMARLLEGLRTAHQRSMAHLRACEPGAAASLRERDRLLSALERVPWQPARTYYEGLVALNWLYYIDGCDSLGRFDQDLGELYEADLAAGRLDSDEGVSLVRALWRNMDANDGWNVALGGTLADGSSAANALTEASLRAGVGLRRPNLALRVTDDLPRPAVEAALDSLASGNGLPALYDDSAYRRAMQELDLGLRPEDRGDFAFGGCTELMVHGSSNVGSLDAGLNLPAILAQTMRERMPTAISYEELFTAFVGRLDEHVRRLAEAVSEAQALHAKWQPQPIRSVLIDDCLDAGQEYNAGGARYNWSVINVGGLANVADSLAVLRQLVFDDKAVTGSTFMEALEHDWRDYENLQRRSQQVVTYGNDEARVDQIARDVAAHTFEALGRHRPWRGGRFLPACLMFVTYADVGASVMATPDGRHAGEPIADAIGPVAGRDRRGPTAMLRSVASLPQELAPGTLVTNLRLSPRMFRDDADRQRVWDLLQTYFRLGGMQLQVNVLDQEALRQAVEHPEAYGDLIVRVGGYSEYWRNLSDALRRTVLERSEHDL
jgi:pyruvate-formate lyase